MSEKNQQSCRLGKVGGQAVMEGVMMKSGERYSVAVLQEDHSITVVDGEHSSIRKKNKFLKAYNLLKLNNEEMENLTK